MLGSFFLLLNHPESSLLYTGHYDPVLVALSIIVAMFTSYASLLVTQHISTSTGAATRRWLTCIGGLSLGGGIWAMHFIGMLAVSLPCSISNDTTITLLSTIAGILACILAIRTISRSEVSRFRLVTGALLIGIGICAMHYSGTAAMRLNGLIRYDVKLFLLSIVVAVTLATCALWIKFRLQPWQAGWNNLTTIASAVVLGLSISGMHYMAMAAAYPIGNGDTDVVPFGIAPILLASIVFVAASLIAALIIVAIFVRKSKILFVGQYYKLIAVLIVCWGGISWLSADYYYKHLANNLYDQALQLARQQAETIGINMDESLQQLEGIPLVLSLDHDTRQAVRRFDANPTPSTSDYEERKQQWTHDKMLSKLDNFLDIAATNLKAGAVWIVNAAGDCIAASNADKPGSFVGTNYADRDYFRQARAGQRGHQYVVGRVSKLPGLYYSAPVIEGGRFLGVVVVKRDIRDFTSWTNQPNALISDANGVIILASDKSLEFRALPDAFVARLSTEQRLKQYARSSFNPLKIVPWGDDQFPVAVRIGGSTAPVVFASKVLADDAITVCVFSPLGGLVRFSAERHWLFLLLAAAGGLLIVAAAAQVFYLRESRRMETDLRVDAAAFESQQGMFVTDGKYSVNP